MKRTIRMAAGMAAISLVALSPWPSSAQTAQPDATFDYSGGSVALGIGYTWGDGVLHFKGKDYRFTANGLDVISVGASSFKASGNVYHLAKLQDFPGIYTEVIAGVTVAGGVTGTLMSNQKGVVMHVGGTNEGLEFDLAPGGVTVALQGPAAAPASGSSSQ